MNDDQTSDETRGDAAGGADSSAEDRTEATTGQSKGRSWRRRALMFGGLSLAALAGMASGRAWAHGHGRGHGGHWGGFCGGHGAHHGGHADHESASSLREHLGERADHLLGALDASETQRLQIGALLDNAAPRMFALKQRGAALHQEAHAAFERGDRQAMELARTRGVAVLDEGSALALATLQDARAVLNADQQAQLREHMARFGGRHRR